MAPRALQQSQNIKLQELQKLQSLQKMNNAFYTYTKIKARVVFSRFLCFQNFKYSLTHLVYFV